MRAGPPRRRVPGARRILASALLFLAVHDRLPASEHPGRYVQAGPARLFVETEGSGPPLLLLPDGPGLDHAYFHPYLSSLSEQATVVYLDPAGCGRSEAPPASDYTLEGMVGEIEAVRAALKLERLDILGHGLGQAVATLYADRHPARVGRVIVLAASSRPRDFLESPGLRAAMTQEMAQAVAAAGLDRYLSADGRFHEEFRILAPLMFYRLTDRAFHKAFAARVTTAAAARAALAPRLAPGGAQAIDLKEALGRLKAPLLIVSGRHDRTASVEEAEAVRDAVPGSRLVVLEESASFPFAEQPVDFLRAVRQFLVETAKDPSVRPPSGGPGPS